MGGYAKDRARGRSTCYIVCTRQAHLEVEGGHLEAEHEVDQVHAVDRGQQARLSSHRTTEHRTGWLYDMSAETHAGPLGSLCI